MPGRGVIGTKPRRKMAGTHHGGRSNGISLTHGSHNVIEGCSVYGNNVTEPVGGIQLEPDVGLEAAGNVVT
jgi:hypothetical protein